jgi:3-phosphoshikimate 1-carboxyvinyltransferase
MKLRMPASKSLTNRALILAALTQGPIILKHPLYADDTQALIDALRTLGLQIDTEPEQIIVHNSIRAIEDGTYDLDARDSGTTARFLLALLCIVPGIKTLRGSTRLSERPILDLVNALRALGAVITSDRLPLTILSSTLTQNAVSLKGDLSSQFCSALLMIAPCLGLTLQLATPLLSKPYVNMTIACMRDWGVDVFGTYHVPEQPYRQHMYLIEGDYSSASYFFAIAALTRSTLTLDNLNPASVQADRHFVTLLAQMGNVIHTDKENVTIEGKQVLPVRVDMQHCPDSALTLAVLAAFAPGVTRIAGVRSLRVKECDRVHALRTELGKMGVRTEETHDHLTIYGGNPHAAEIDTYNDHRIAMAFAVARTRLPEMKIRHPEVVQKTFPSFWEKLCLLC